MFSIGEFSRSTGLTVKTLRFYHDKGVLIPACVDEQTGYRFYNESQVDLARVITQLRRLEFPLSEILEILRDHDDDADILDELARRRDAITDKLARYREIKRQLDLIVAKEWEAREMMATNVHEVVEKELAPMRIAGLRMRGKYQDCGKGFARIGRRFGRHICGKPMLLIYDTEYRETDADFAACMPVRKGTDVEGISVHDLPGGHAVTLVHVGPYEELGRSYEKLLAYIQEHGYQTTTPCREVYIKGPGMIFRGNPRKYVTELQMLVETET